MQFVHKFIGPADLRSRKRKYYHLLKVNNIFDFKSKTLTEDQKDSIYDFYKNHKGNGLGYNTYLTKKLLLRSSKNRCCFCGRFICDSTKYEPSQKYKYLSIEHYKEECRYPLNVLDWSNLFPSCNECNNKRDSKEISYQNSPSNRRFANEVKKIFFLSNGEVGSTNECFNSIFDSYKLNSDDLKHQRSVFFGQITNPFFAKLLKFEREKSIYHCNAIIFIDEYLYVSRRKNYYNELKNSKLYRLSKEVLENE